MAKARELTDTKGRSNETQELAKAWLSTLGELDLGPFFQVLHETWRLLGKGRPVPVKRLASRLGVSREQADALLQQLGAELDADGNLVGMGLSLTPTPHRVVLEGTDVPLYVWCVPDAISLSAALGIGVQIESPDPVTGELTRLHLAQDGVTEVEPRNAVVSFLKPRSEQLKDLRGSVCDYQNIFQSEETARRWFEDGLDNVVIVAPSDAFDLIRLIFAEMLPERLGQ